LHVLETAPESIFEAVNLSLQNWREM